MDPGGAGRRGTGAPASRVLDAYLKDELRAAGLEVHSHPGSLLVEPWEVSTGAGGHYKVFTPSWKAAADLPVGVPLPVPEPQDPPADQAERLERLHRDGVAVPLEQLGLLDHDPRWWEDTLARHWDPGCIAAEDALARLDEAVTGYGTTRDLPADEHSTSRLSPRLRFGELSPRQLVHAVNAHPELGAPENEDRRAWVRQLWQSGWVHNRVRLVVGSFLAKDLLHPWWDGEQWFWDTLVDADEANNPVSWQWVAGCGADAAPYFRVFNPETQRERFDADNVYVRRWVPEALEPLSGYPEPLVDLKESRRHALDAYEAMKNAAS